MGSSLDEAAVRHVAHLARLKITDDEVARYAEQLSSVLRYVEQLNELNTEDVPATSHAWPVTNVFRPDEAHTSFSVQQALSNAPQRQDSFFAVPKVLDQDQEGP